MTVMVHTDDTTRSTVLSVVLQKNFLHKQVLLEAGNLSSSKIIFFFKYIYIYLYIYYSFSLLFYLFCTHGFQFEKNFLLPSILKKHTIYHSFSHCEFCTIMYVCIFFLIYKHLLLCMLHYYAAILHALMVTFTYYLLLSTYYIYRFVPYLLCHIYTLDFV